jgi:sugar phosphate isomerase/epimerase
MLSSYINGVHCKDGIASPVGGVLGKELALGAGSVDFMALLRGLRRIGFEGPLIIEREQGSKVREDVLSGRRYLEKILADL